MVSSTSVYGVNDGSWVDEKTESDAPRGDSKWISEMERVILSSDIPAIILRLGGIYGPYRHRLKQIEQGKFTPSFSDAYVNRIHVQDAVAGLELLIYKGRAGDVYLGVDDYPSTQKEFYTWLYEQLGWSLPQIESLPKDFVHGSNKRCSNKKIKDLGLSLKYPTFKEGYSEILKKEV